MRSSITVIVLDEPEAAIFGHGSARTSARIGGTVDALETCWNFVRKSMAPSEFEAWVYRTAALADMLGPELQMQMISLNYHDRMAVADLRSMLRARLVGLMPTALTVMFVREDDDYGALSACVESHGFAGHGEAYFSNSQVEKFVAEVAVGAYTQREITLAGGTWDGQGTLKHEEVGIHVKGLPDAGASVRVRLSRSVSTRSAPLIIGTIETVMAVSDEDLAAFTRRLGSALHGASEKLILTGSCTNSEWCRICDAG